MALTLSRASELNNQLKEAVKSLNRLADVSAKLGLVVEFDVLKLGYLDDIPVSSIEVKVSVDPTILKV